MRASAFHSLYPVKMSHEASGKSVIVMCFCMCFRMSFRFSFLFYYVDQFCFDINEVIRIKPFHKYQPGFWKFNNSLPSDTNYVELLTFKIPMLAKKHEQVNDKGLYWERIKMEIRAFTIAFSKKKAKRERDEESIILSEMMRLQTKLQTSYSDRAGENKIQAFENCVYQNKRNNRA